MQQVERFIPYTFKPSSHVVQFRFFILLPEYIFSGYMHHEFISIIQYNIISLINEQYDANGPVERRETSSLLMSTCPITITYNEIFNVIQELHTQHTKV